MDGFHPSQRQRSRASRSMRGSALLEVVISLSILVVAMGVVGFAFRNCQLNLDRSERVTRAMLLADQVLTNIDLGILSVTSQAESSQGQGNLTEVSGVFGVDAPPGMSYRVQAGTDNALPGVIRLYIEIYAGDPDDESHQLILATSALRAPPRSIDLERDFGLPAEQTQKIQDQIPGGSQVFDPKNFDPRALASMDMDTLIQMLPLLMQAFGGAALAGHMDEIMDAARSGDIQKLQDIAQEAAPSGMLPNPTKAGNSSGQQGPAPSGQQSNPRKTKDR